MELIAGRYEKKHLLGEGGMGAVYLANDNELSRLVALKMVRTDNELDLELALKRFMEEGKNSSQLSHANIISVYDLFTVDGVPWMAMEYVQGKSLRQLFDEGISVKESVPLLKQVARALAYAHEEGVVHRDLKPENVLVTKDGIAKVGDWGLSQRTEDESGLTKTGLIVGTPDYLAPERIDRAKTTPASDLYALGCMLFEAHEGRPPFKHDELIKVLQAQLRKEPPKAPRATGKMNKLIRELLAKKPNRRPQSAHEVAQRLAEDDDLLQRATKEKTIAVPQAKAVERASNLDWRRLAIGLSFTVICVATLLYACHKSTPQVRQPKMAGGKVNVYKNAQLPEVYQRVARGQADAANALFDRLRFGKASEQDKEFAIKALEIGVARNYARCMYILGKCYQKGLLIDVQGPKAISLLTRASDRDYVAATAALADCYARGTFVERSGTRAFALYSKGAKQNHPYCLVRTGECLLKGWGTKRDVQKAHEYLAKAAQRYSGEAHFLLARCYERGKGRQIDTKKALFHYQQGANLHFPRAMAYLGHLHEHGMYGLQKSATKAYRHYQRAHKAKDIGGTTKLARCYEYGIGTQPNAERAVKLYKRLLKYKFSDALLGLARCYEKGKGIEKNERKAFKLVRQAASKGNRLALGQLAFYYENGIGCKKNPARANKLRTRMGSSHINSLFELH